MLDDIESMWAEAHDGESIWENEAVTFLDPFTKSGVFLREIVKRLIEGLAQEIPDLQERVDHILTRQVFGIGITSLTSLLARRSLYCSKSANGEHSISSAFSSADGNVWFEPTQHTWSGGKCSYCGAGKRENDRAKDLETHAYAFIHTDDIGERIAEIFGGNMQFDVIVGNPPYQLDDGGYGTSAAPIYDKFVEQAKRLDPRLLTMVIPARWFAGGKGLDGFRESMLNDDRIRVIEDFPDSSEVFPGVQIKGGVCYFVWSRDERGECRVTTHDKGEAGLPVTRPLLESGADVFVRYNEALSILKKIMASENGNDSLALNADQRFAGLVSSRKPFGLDTAFVGREVENPGDLLVYRNGGTSYISREKIDKGVDVIDEWKIFIPYAGSGSDSFPHSILGRPFAGGPGSISSEMELIRFR